MKDLPPKQKLFCKEYVSKKELNGTRAYMEVYKTKSEATAGVNASRLLGNARIKEYIAELQKATMDKLDLKAEDVIRELMALGFWNIQDFLDEGNTIKDMTTLDRNMTKAVTGVKTKVRTDEFGVTKEVELKTADKRGALVDLARYLGLFEKDNKQKSDKIVVGYTPVEEEDDE